MMHEGEIRADADQVRQLLAEQFREWADLPISPVAEHGTDHLLFRLGDELVARMPLVDWATDQAESDQRWLPALAPQLPLAVPVPLAVGAPGAGYPWPWSVVPWIVGETPTADNLDLRQAALDLAAFVTALRGIDTAGGPVKTGMSRGAPLAALDDVVRTAIAELGDRVDERRVTAAWDQALSADEWSGPPAWIHGDLQSGNLLARERRLVAVIDFGALGLGDPAPDLSPAWNLLDGCSRALFRDAVGCDDDMWARGRGWVLAPALTGMGYYWDTFPAFAALSRQRIDAVLADQS
jgi:aminoglycoside phosphotransferase (APT) family kinase protein